MMENLGLWLIGGLFMCFMVIPALVFLTCVRRVDGKWNIRKDGIATYLYGKKAITGCTPKNMCELYECAILRQLEIIVLFSVVIFIVFLFIFAVMYILSLPILKMFSTLFLIAVILCAIFAFSYFVTEPKEWKKLKSALYQKIIIFQKISQAFQEVRKVQQKAADKVCIKFENA